MTKKSLFFGAAAAALTLLVLLTVIGCSNPSSGTTEYVSQASSGYPFPPDTVFVDDWAAFIGLLNDYTAETNQVLNIAYGGNSASFADPLIIPSGKTVYLTDDHANIGENITVREGARLVLVGDFTAGNTGLLLVRGTVEVFKSLTVTTSALDVADYTVENQIENGRNTVIGSKVSVLPGAALILDISDIIPPTESQPNKFTPAQAWAAAGQGHLVIGTGATPGNPSVNPADTLTAYSYTVADLLTGVSPRADRTYTVTSGRITTETLPAVIPQGAYIYTSAIPKGSVGNTLTVNGALQTLGTLNDITKLEVGNGGALSLAEPDGELLTGLTELKLGPGARFAITNDDVSLKALETLFLGDGSYLSVPGTNVTFKEDTPLALTLGKNVAYSVGMSPSAKLNTVIAKDASLVSSSTLTVYPGSTFTVNEGVTFTVEGSSTFDIGKLPIPTADETPLVTINGTIEIADGSSFVGLDAQANPANLYKTLTLGADGKVLLDYGAFFYFGATGQKFVGDNGDSATYEWATAPDDGAQIEINQGGLIIRDTDSIDTPVAIGVAAEGAAILKDQSLYLDRGVSLTIASGFNLSLFGDIDTNGGGAKLLGPGKVITGTDIAITGGDYGWQAIGDNINIGNGTASLQSISSAIPASATVSATLKALGLGAVIDIADGETLEIKEDLTVDLNGSNLRKAGEIVLGNASEIELEEVDSVILTGANPAGHATAVALDATYTSEVDTGAFNAIGVAELGGDGTYALAVTTAAPNLTDNTLPSGKLYSLTGTSGNPGTVTATANGASISSETVTAADDT